MSWTSWVCIAVIICGIVLFLYGANYYEAAVGFVGVYLFAAGVIAMLALYVYGELTKKGAQKP
jgi:uncharacterized membrane protein HdeD (DUF308 family)